MSKDFTEVKITGWSYKGFKTPDVEIKIEDNAEGNRNFTLYQMLSGEGKTTTLKLLRNSFYDINKELNKKLYSLCKALCDESKKLKIEIETLSKR